MMVDLNDVLEAGRLLLSATLKGSALIVIVAMIQWIGRERIPAGWRYAMWLVVIARLLLPAAPESRFSMFNFLSGGISPVTFVYEKAPLAPPQFEARFPDGGTIQASPRSALPAALIAIWAAGAIALAARAVGGSLRLASRLRADARGYVPDARLAAAVAQGASELGIRRTVGIVETSSVGSPALHGMVFPKLLVPRGVLDQFSAEELRYIVLHELAHLRRADVLVNVVAAAVECLHWFNPLVWIALARMREERELACDRAALARIPADARAEYGRTVLKLLNCFRTPAFAPALVGMASRHDEMKRRILMIAAFKKSSRASLAFAGVVALLGFASLTDAQTVKHALFHSELTPEAKATFDRLGEPIKVEFKETSVFDIVQSIAGKAGVTVTVAPEAAAALAAAPQLSLTAENLPAHVAVVEALSAVDLGLKFTATGIEIVKGEEGGQRVRIIVPGEHATEDQVIMLGDGAQWEAKFDDDAVVTTTGDEQKVERIFIKHKSENSEAGDDPQHDAEVRKQVRVIRTHAEGAEGSGEVKVQRLEDAKLEIEVHRK